MPMVSLGKMVEEQNIQIPWSVISKRMVKRSRLSCFKKWQKLTGLFPEEGKKYKDDDDEDGDVDKTGADDMSLPVAKRIKIEGDSSVAFPQAPTAGAAAALAAAASTGNGGAGNNSYYELYDSAKIADATVEGKSKQSVPGWVVLFTLISQRCPFLAVGLPDTDSLVPAGSNKIII